jgi:DNA polymerase III delta' subunit
MEGARTRGHPAALAAVGSMVRGGAPHAVLLVGPAGVGKTTLALDLAAGLLCTDADPSARPCGSCRACRLVGGGGHPDLHRLGPDGPGRQVLIGGPGAKARGVRDLIGELALLPVEGGARVAIVESAQRMNEDAQAAMLKTLEEPPPGVTIVLCADAEEPLLPTIRSRCARLRLGPVGVREIESILEAHGAADAPLGARLARIAGGRPGIALAWARQPDALRARDELGRTLLDLAGASPAERVAGMRTAVARAAALAVVADDAVPAAGVRAPAGPPSARTPPRGKNKGGPAGAADPTAPATATAVDAARDDAPAVDAAEVDELAGPIRTPASERRRSAEALVSLWTDVARDLALAQLGLGGSVRDLGLLDETEGLAALLDGSDLTAFLDRLGRAALLLANNVSPELVLDDLALSWPRVHRTAA